MGGVVAALVEVALPLGAGRGRLGTEVLGEEGEGNAVLNRPNRGGGKFWLDDLGKGCGDADGGSVGVADIFSVSALVALGG